MFAIRNVFQVAQLQLSLVVQGFGESNANHLIESN